MVACWTVPFLLSAKRVCSTNIRDQKYVIRHCKAYLPANLLCGIQRVCNTSGFDP